MHARDPTLFQHQGIGTLLMEEAERIAREEHGSRKLAVISGVGVRSYYARLGYTLEGPYMTCVSARGASAVVAADPPLAITGRCWMMTRTIFDEPEPPYVSLHVFLHISTCCTSILSGCAISRSAATFRSSRLVFKRGLAGWTSRRILIH